MDIVEPDFQPRVLVVDDDPLIVETLQEIFAQAGLAHDGAASGQEALEKLASGQFDAVVLDAVMPDLSGPEVLRRLRRSSFERPAILYFTAYPDISAYDTFLGGADAVLIKPRPSEELVDTVRYLADKRRIRLAKEQETDRSRSRIEQAGRRASIYEVAGTLVHELKNPLSAASGFAYSIKRDLEKHGAPSQALIAKLGKLENCLERINNYLTSIAHLSAERSGGSNATTEGTSGLAYPEILPDEGEPTNIKLAIAETIGLIRSQLAAGSIRLYVAEIADTYWTSMPLTALQLILRQLITNACEAVVGQDDRWIKISTEKLENDYEIQVTDSGNGILAAERALIMEPFFKGSIKNKVATEASGFSESNLGLGLAIAKRMADRHGGTLSLAEDLSPTKFILTIPQFR